MPSSAWRSDVCSSDRSEEHTSELQSQSNLVCRILIEKKHTSELQSQSNLVCRLLLEKKKTVFHHQGCRERHRAWLVHHLRTHQRAWCRHPRNDVARRR